RNVTGVQTCALPISVVARQYTAERWVLLLDEIHRLVDLLPDLGLLRDRLNVAPARQLRHPEHAVTGVFVAVFEEVRQSLRFDALRGKLCLERRTSLLEAVGDVLEEHQAQHDMLVLARLLVAAQLV